MKNNAIKKCARIGSERHKTYHKAFSLSHVLPRTRSVPTEQAFHVPPLQRLLANIRHPDNVTGATRRVHPPNERPPVSPPLTSAQPPSTSYLPIPSRRASHGTCRRSSCQHARLSTLACCRWNPCDAEIGWAASWKRPTQRTCVCRPSWKSETLTGHQDRAPLGRPWSDVGLDLRDSRVSYYRPPARYFLTLGYLRTGHIGGGGDISGGDMCMVAIGVMRLLRSLLEMRIQDLGWVMNETVPCGIESHR